MSSQSLRTLNSQTPPVEVKVGDVLQEAGPVPVCTKHLATDPQCLRMRRYLRLMGVTCGDASAKLAETLFAAVEAQGVESSQRLVAAIRHFERWSESIADALGLAGEPGRVGVACLSELGRLLEANPALLMGEELPAEVVETLRSAVERWPRGVLPVCAELDMHRQPLGELPMVLRGEFWSGTYRWVVPTAKVMRQQTTEEPAR